MRSGVNRRALLVAAGSLAASLAGCSERPEDAVDPISTGTAESTTDDRQNPTDGTGPSAESTRSPTSANTDTATATTAPPPCDGVDHPFLTAADGFSVGTYADATDLGGGPFSPGPDPGPRMLATYRGTLYATIPAQDRVVALPGDGSGSAADIVTVNPDSLTKPHGIAFHDDRLYLATASRVVRYRMDGLEATDEEVLVDDVPQGVYHWTRSLAVHDDRLYLSAGNCPSGDCSGGDDGYLATVTAFGLDGSNRTTYATGLRNAVGIGWHDGKLFATDNGIDDLGPDLPPDEINVVEEGRDYGFPDCYGDNVPVDDESPDCEGRATPVVELQAHVAPLGFDFATTGAFPASHRGDMYVALHGSWTRDDPVGYEVIRVPYDGSLGDPTTFVTGWMPEGGTNEDARGRPADVCVADTGEMYVSDDLSGTIYRVCHSG
jgi:glucose/arabinose dehydrogenase